MRAFHASPSGGTTSSAADWRPRTSPPSPSAASTAAISRSASSPSACSNAADIAAGTVSRSIMFAWHDQCAPTASPAHGMQSGPVWTATPPLASTTPTWRTAPSGSAAISAASASAALSPASIRSSACGPCATSTTDWVATAPTPGRAQMQSEPTREPVRLHGRSELPGGRVEGDDRVGAVAHRARISV